MNTATKQAQRANAVARMMERTPRPWCVTGEWPAVITIRAKGCAIAEILPQGKFVTPANAAFIVRACNAHDDLLAALKDCAKAIEEEVGASMVPRGDHPMIDAHADTAKRARAAIAKAES